MFFSSRLSGWRLPIFNHEVWHNLNTEQIPASHLVMNFWCALALFFLAESKVLSFSILSHLPSLGYWDAVEEVVVVALRLLEYHNILFLCCLYDIPSAQISNLSKFFAPMLYSWVGQLAVAALNWVSFATRNQNVRFPMTIHFCMPWKDPPPLAIHWHIYYLSYTISRSHHLTCLPSGAVHHLSWLVSTGLGDGENKQQI